MKQIRIASVVNIVVNVFLFGIKIVAGMVFSSISLISDAINSLSDIIAAVFIYFSVKINNKAPDKDHQFGHTRAENIAGYTTGILMMILGVSIIKLSIDKILNHEVMVYSPILIFVIVTTFVLKLGMYVYIKILLNNHFSPALKANLQDHLNDVLIISGVFIAIILTRYGYYLADPIAGLIISIFVLKAAYDIIRENLDFLMGISVDSEIEEKIRDVILSYPEVEGINLIKTQYLGSKVQVEAHIALDSGLSLKESHDIGEKVKSGVEKKKYINDCFIHIEPNQDK